MAGDKKENMYMNIYITNNNPDHGEMATVYLWDDETGLQTFPYKDFDYAYKPDKKGKYISITGVQLKKISRYSREDTDLFESDLPRETRVLTDLYLNENNPSKNHRKLFFDIEVDSTGGFGSPSTAEKQITAISMECNGIAECYVLDENKKLVGHDKLSDAIIYRFDTEENLLEHWLERFREINPTIISGWNIDNYDIPYLYNRFKRLFGKDTADMLSPIGLVRYSNMRERYIIAGINTLDYLKLYKKFTFNQRASYRLAFIAKAELEGIEKIVYDGTLDDLRQTDLLKFVEYSVVDTRIVRMIDDKLKFIELTQYICHKGCVPYEDFPYSSKFIEGTIIAYLHRKGIIVNNKSATGREEYEQQLEDDDDKFEGAYVKPPNPGLYENVYELDLQSLYPSVMMSLNISPETKVGRIKNWNAEQHLKNEIKEYIVVANNVEKAIDSRHQFEEWMNENKLTISSCGVLYSTTVKGIIPEILSQWFEERLEYIKLMKKYSDEGNKELMDYYDRLQYVQKVFLNSIYGVLGLPIFRFYDLDNAESVTLTGQTIIKSTEKFLNNWYKTKGVKPREQSEIDKYKTVLLKELKDGKITTEDMPNLLDPHNHCIYIDTDSNYFSATPFIKEGDNKLEVTKAIAKEAEKKANVFYDKLASAYFFCHKHRFFIKGGAIIETGFWIKKKNYALKKVYDLEKDKPITKDQLKVKGLAIVRSDFPPAFRDFMKNILDDIINHCEQKIVDDKILEFRKKMTTMDFKQLMSNKAVKDIGKWNDKKQKTLNVFVSKTPAHVKAAITYNRYLKIRGFDKKNEPIRDGDKIKYAILKTNPANLETLALKTYDDPQEFVDLIIKYFDYDATFESNLVKKLEAWYEALSWGTIPTKMSQTAGKFFSF